MLLRIGSSMILKGNWKHGREHTTDLTITEAKKDVSKFKTISGGPGSSILSVFCCKRMMLQSLFDTWFSPIIYLMTCLPIAQLLNAAPWSSMQLARLPCSLLSPGACWNSHPLSWWCHPIILSSVIPFSSCLQSFPASGSFPMSGLFEWGGLSLKNCWMVMTLLKPFVLLFFIFPM